MKCKKLLAILLALCLILSLTSCGQKSEQDKKFDELTKSSAAPESQPESSQTSEPASKPESAPAGSLSGELTVSSWARIESPSQLEIMAEEFMDLNPDVTITVDYAETNISAIPDVNQSRDSYCAQVRAELVSGEADYILYSPPGKLNLYDISKSGVLLDLRPYFDSDPTINPDEYFTQVLDTVSVDGKLTSMPFSFYFDGMYLNRKAMESINVDTSGITTLNSDMLLDWYERARAANPEIKLLFGEQGKDFLFGDEKFAYIDVDGRAASFQSPEFTRFLERTNALDDAEPNLDKMANMYAQNAYLVHELLRCQASGEETSLDESQDPYAYQFVTGGRAALACVTNMNIFALTDIGFDMEHLAGPYPVTDTQGRLAVSSIDDFAVPSSMKNPDLAWAFISYCLGERESTILTSEQSFGSLLYSQNAPLNKKNFALLAEEFSTVPGTIGYEQLVGKTGKEIDGEALAQKMDEHLSMGLVNRKLYSPDVQEYLDEFYNSGLTTAEQCAEKIQGRVDIWLHE